MKCPKCGSSDLLPQTKRIDGLAVCNDCYIDIDLLENLLSIFSEYDEQRYTYDDWLNYDREENNFWFVTETGKVIDYLSFKTVESLIKDINEVKK